MMRNGLPAMAPVPLDLDFEKTEMKYDSTGMFHWTAARPIEDCMLDRQDIKIIIPSSSSSIFAGTRRP